MKKVLATLALMFGAVSANAATSTEVEFSSCTITRIAVSSTSANPSATKLFTAELSGATTDFPKIMADRTFLEIQNIDTSTFTWVFVGVGLSSSASYNLTAGSFAQPDFLSTSYGEMIAPQGGKLKINLRPYNPESRAHIPWAVNNGGVGTANVIVKQCR